MIKNPKIGDKIWFTDVDLEYNIVKKSGVVSAIFTELSGVEIDYWHFRAFDEVWKTSKIPESAFERKICQLLEDLEDDKSKIDKNIKNLIKQLGERYQTSATDEEKKLLSKTKSLEEFRRELGWK